MPALHVFKRAHRYPKLALAVAESELVIFASLQRSARDRSRRCVGLDATSDKHGGKIWCLEVPTIASEEARWPGFLPRPPEPR